MTIETAPEPGSSAFFVAGIGCRIGTPGAEIIALITTALLEAGLSADDLGLIATLDAKLDEAGIIAAADHFDVSLRGISRETLLREELPNPSARVQRAIGLPGVAEAAAMALGPLMLPKRTSRSATCALGRMDMTVAPPVPATRSAAL